MNFRKLLLWLVVLCYFPFSQGQSVEQRIENIISKMTLEEKILQLHQESSFNTAENTRLGIPGFFMADGPHGVRDGLATAYPVGISMAATWDTELMYRLGVSMGKEFRGKGKNQALGHAMDITRDPRNGRTAESGGEDPYLVASITSSLIKGMQTTGVIATAKHFNGDSQQLNRFTNNYTVSQRNLVEHLGVNYRMAVQDAGVFSVMNAYNLINGKKCAENANLLTNILRGVWGFPYYVVSDWNSIWSSRNAILAGCNICMGSDHYRDELPSLVATGQVSVAAINEAVRSVLRTKILSGMMDYYPEGNPSDVNSTESKNIALESALKSVILLKNTNNILPINKNNVTKIAVIGPSANVCQLDGSGSAYVTPFYSVSPRQGLINKLGSSKVVYAKGCDINSTSTTGYQEALSAATGADYVIFFGGLDETQEGEGFDRVGESINLPGKQQDLINKLAAVNSNIIVVLESGGICGIQDCESNIKGLLYAFYPGQEGGNALASVLLGDYNPAGRLPVTYPLNDEQLPPRDFDFNNDFGCGYRWFDEKDITPLFPFGFGLSYTTFQYSNIVLSSTSANVGERITISADVKNTGAREGDEVVQLYISDTTSSFYMPEKQLKAFKRINLQPGETKTVSFDLTSEDFYFFDSASVVYKVNPGTFIVRVGGSSVDLPLTATLNLVNTSVKPDLKISWIKTIPAYPVKGDTVTFLAAVKNMGSGISTNNLIHKVVFKINGEVVSSYSAANFIKTGGMKVFYTTSEASGSNAWIPSQTGTYNIEAVIDPDNTISECLEDNNTTITAVKVFNKPAVNLAKNMTVTASSIEGIGLEASKAIDGNRGSRWASQFSDPQYIYVDLGAVKHFRRIDLYWEAAFGKNYLIQTSNNSSDWTTVATVVNGDGGLDRIYVSADARYIRMYGTQRGTVYGYSLYEFEVYEDSVSTGVETGELINADTYYLSANYPNPFNPGTTIEFSLPANNNVKLQIFNSIGELVTTLLDRDFSKGQHQVYWNGKDGNGSVAPAGVYFYRIVSGNFIETKKMILLK